MGDSGWNSKTRMLARMWTVKAKVRRFRLEIRTSGSWARDHEGYTLADDLFAFCPYLETLEGTMIKANDYQIWQGNFKTAQCSGYGMDTSGCFWPDL